MRIVVDSNIVFSALLNTQSNIGQLIINGSKYFEFYSIGQLKDEIIFHKYKILSITGYSENQFKEIFRALVERIQFVDDFLISDKEINKAIRLVSNIDENDAMFVALTNHMLSRLWTGDKKLIKGLKREEYTRIITTEELYKIYLDKEIKSRQKRKK